MARITYDTLVTNPRSTETFSTGSFARTRQGKRGARAEGEGAAGVGVWPAVAMKERQYHGKARPSGLGYSVDVDYLQASLSGRGYTESKKCGLLLVGNDSATKEGGRHSLLGRKSMGCSTFG